MDIRERKKVENLQNEEEAEEMDFKPLYVLIFSKTASYETVSRIVDILTRSQCEGGAELLIRKTKLDTKEIIVEVGAEHVRLLEAAETFEITKEDKNGNLREFIFSDIKQFLKPGVDINNLLSTSEKQRVIYEEIMGIISRERKTLEGSNILLYPGQSIIEVCKKNGIITDFYPLHEKTELKTLRNKWSFTSLPLGDVRNYFGEGIAFYFSFLCFYTWALLPPAVIGLLQTIISFDISRSHIFFSFFKMIWLTLFLECWKRRSNELAYTWGTLRLVNIPKLHPTFRGKHMDIDHVTGQHIPIYPAYKRQLKVYCVSLPLVIICLGFAIVVMKIYFEIESMVLEMYDDDSYESLIITLLPGIVYAILVLVMNTLYSYVATILTEWENHKVDESFENHRIVKLLLFEFVNNFVSLGYTAFYLQDLGSLKKQIAIMMIVNHLFNQFQMSVLPYLLKKLRKMFKSSVSKVSPRVDFILEQREMWAYEETYYDYLEIFTQFGNVFLFSSVFPLAAVLAIFNNLIEMRMDGFKLCYSYQRPQARPVKGIGVWQIAFEVLSLIAVMSNCALICMSPIIRSYAPDMSLSTWLLIGVSVEHVVIAIKMTLAYVISDVPKWVKLAIQKAQYESLKALKVERKKKTEVMMQSINFRNMTKME